MFGIVWLTICIEPPPTSLNLTKRKLWLDTGGVAIHHETDSSAGSDYAGLSVSVTVLIANFNNLVPHFGKVRELGDRFRYQL